MARSNNLVFTDLLIRKLKPQDKKYVRSEGNGFTVRVSPAGLKTWLYAYGLNDKRREMGLGTYPEVSLHDAREKFEEARQKVKGGIDPMDERDQAEEASRQAPTVADLVDEYLRKHAMVNKKSWKEDKRSLEKDILPKWGKRKAADIKKRDVVLLLEGIVERGAPIQANNTLEKIRKMFNFAVERDILEYTPCYGVKKPVKQVFKDRVLTDKEICLVWDGLDSAPMTQEMRRVLKLILITGQRPGEVVGLHSSEINGDWWTIPAERAKNGRTHRVFLAPTAKELIGDKQGYIFESPRGGKPMDGNAVAYSVRRSLEIPGRQDGKGEDASGTGEDIAGRKLEMEPWTPHDLRRTAATNMSALGFPDETVDAVLNHVKKGVIAIYNRHGYDKEKQQALEAWERRLKVILGGGTGAKVIPLVRRMPAEE
jgi:integrase